MTSPPQHDPYTKLRTELLNRLPLSREQRARRIHTLHEMGDRKSSQFLRDLRSIVPDVLGYFLLTIWTSRLPAKAQATLACHPEVELDSAADSADRITETVPPQVLASIGQPTDNNELLRRIDELSRKVAALSTERKYPSSRNPHYNPRDRTSSARNRSSYNGPPSRHHAATTFCRYHRRFGPRAQNCTQPCAFHKQRNPAQPAAAAEHVCNTATGRLFISDKSTKQRFLIDMGSNL
jgi:hypothetical protein